LVTVNSVINANAIGLTLFRANNSGMQLKGKRQQQTISPTVVLQTKLDISSNFVNLCDF